MGGGNGQKSKMAREKNMEKNKAVKGSQLDSNKKAMTIQWEETMVQLRGRNVELDHDERPDPMQQILGILLMIHDLRDELREVLNKQNEDRERRNNEVE